MIPWLLAMIACVAPMRDKGVVPAQSTLEALQQAREPRRFAVVVGVDAFDDPTFPALKHVASGAGKTSEEALVLKNIQAIRSFSAPRVVGVLISNTPGGPGGSAAIARPGPMGNQLAVSTTW